MDVRIAGLDPGKQRSSFAFVGTEIRDKTLYVLGARRWQGRAYLDVERAVGKIHINKPFDHYVVEKNNTGEHVIEVLTKQYQLPVIPVWTGKEFKDNKKVFSPRHMDKNEMVKYMIILWQSGKIIFAEPETPEMTELKRQLTIFGEHKTETGQISYYAAGEEHDDLVMALMLACFLARFYLDKRKSAYAGFSKSYSPNTEDLLGTAVPYGATSLGRWESMP